jgi:hypothetical protein
MNHELDPETEAAETAETEKRQKTIAMIDQTLIRINRISAEITAVEIHLGLPQSSGDPLEQRLQRLRSFLTMRRSCVEAMT